MIATFFTNFFVIYNLELGFYFGQRVNRFNVLTTCANQVMNTLDTICFVCKPFNIADFNKSLHEKKNLELRMILISKTKQLSDHDYDVFVADFYKDQDWFDGLDGVSEDGIIQVIKVTAPHRQTLYIDPSGYRYARYVGVHAAIL